MHARMLALRANAFLSHASGHLEPPFAREAFDVLPSLTGCLTRLRSVIWTATFVLGSGCSASQELPVVARGRYVEIATSRDEPICGGTVAYMDRFVTSAFAVLGEAPPDDVFVRFEWLELDARDPLIGGGRTKTIDDHVLIQSDVYLIEEHELVHAVQFSAWPSSNPFLREGLAVFLDAKRLYQQSAWADDVSLDDVLAADPLTTQHYPLAWFLVSQIVRDHGFEGLRDLWYAIPAGSSAGEVRLAYEQVFGRPIDTLLEDVPVEPGMDPDQATRRACDFGICAAAETPWVGGVWTAPGPTDCEDDPDAVGPDGRVYLSERGEVWRNSTIVMEHGWYETEMSPSVSRGIAGCSLRCEWAATGLTGSPPGYHEGPSYTNMTGPYRVDVRSALADLPTDVPGTVTVRESAP